MSILLGYLACNKFLYYYYCLEGSVNKVVVRCLTVPVVASACSLKATLVREQCLWCQLKLNRGHTGHAWTIECTLTMADHWCTKQATPVLGLSLYLLTVPGSQPSTV